MLYKPLFIIHVVKSLLKSYTVVQKTTSVTKVVVVHTYCIMFYKNAKFQVSLQINEILLHNKK